MAHMDDVDGELVEVHQIYPGLQETLTHLEEVLDVSSFVFVNDHPGTALRARGGKDTLVTDLLVHKYGKSAAIVVLDCLLGKTAPQVLFDHIVDGLAGWTPGWRNDFHRWNGHRALPDDGESCLLGSVEEGPPCQRERTDMDGCDGLLTRIGMALKYRSESTQATRAFLVFDRAEFLRDWPESTLVVLARLGELTKTALCAIFISPLDWSSFRPRIGGWTCPYPIHLPHVSKDSFRAICKRTWSYPREETLGSAQTIFLDALYDTFWRHSRSLSQMRELAHQLWPAFIQPLARQTAVTAEVVKLVALAKPDWASRLDQLNLPPVAHHEVASQVHDDEDTLRSMAVKQVHREENLEYLRDYPELSFYARYIIVAAYLASYNVPRSDISIFSRAEQLGKKRRRRKRHVATERDTGVTQQVLGPKIIPLERLIAIYFAILPAQDCVFGQDDEVIETVYDTFYQQLNQLCATRLVQRITSMDKVEQVRFRVALRYSQVKAIGQTVGCHLDDWLYQVCEK